MAALDRGFEYKQRDFVPIKLGSALYSKLQRRYWETSSMANVPIILAIETFHDAASLYYSSAPLSTYLYGYRHDHLWDAEGRLLIVPSKVETHTFGGKTIPSGFFFLPGACHISAVLFSNSGTVSKFNRMGHQGLYFDPRITLMRFGMCQDPDPDAAVPKYFFYTVGDPQFEEWWAQGLEIFHNPVARHPVDPTMFPGITHHHFEDGMIHTDGPPFHPFTSFTYNITIPKPPNAVST